MNPIETIEVPVDDIGEDATQPRGECDADSLQALGKTMVESGQVESLLAYFEDGKYRLLSGGRRLRAARMAGIERLTLRVIAKPASPAAAIEIQLLANLHEPLAPMDYARAVANYRRATGLSAVKVAERLGTSPASISRAERLCQLPPRIQELVAAEKLGADVAYQISLADAADQECLAEQAVDHGLSRDAVAAQVRASRGSRRGERSGDRKAARVTADLGGGRQVAFSAKAPLTIEAAIEWLEELLAKARKFRNRGASLETLVAQLKLDAKAGRSAGEPKS